ncbi:MAG TPA: 3-dehydroquinate synthase [Pyrinomonadaceae bacterium]|nr:3-dehydroquinate synthase [Pyrinomonadaceae bacterium]
MQQLQVRLKARPDQYEIKIARGLVKEAGSEIRKTLGIQTRQVAVISNQKVFRLFGASLITSLRSNDFAVTQWLMGDGERFKSLSTVNQALLFLTESGLQRTDAVVALGGGVVGDLAGFVAATYLRGVPFIQIPTTLIAQTDAAIGGKTGVNLPLGKNLVGAFHQPRGILIDTATLITLPPRELTAGWCEVIKQGAVGSRALFKKTTRLLETIAANRETLVSTEMEGLIRSHCAFKASIVSGDERESPDRQDHRSRRILNFGHTTGHALEAATRYRRFRHGEAVGHGMIVAGEISKNLGLLAASELELLRHAVRLCGPLPAASDLDEGTILSFLRRDKKVIAGRLNWVLLERIGRARIVDEKEITPRLLRDSIRAGLS